MTTAIRKCMHIKRAKQCVNTRIITCAEVPYSSKKLFFFSCVFLRIFSEERGFGEVAGIPVFSRFYRNFSQEFLWDRNSCIYSGFLRIPEDS
jgi:hypothetical protein